MAKPVRISVTVEGWKEISRKLKADTLLAGPWREAMQETADTALAAWKSASPSASGQMRGSMIGKIQARPMPMWAAVRATATRTSRKYKRYRYPGRQEYDPRSRNKGKLKAALNGAMGRIQSILGGAARRIEAKWGA